MVVIHTFLFTCVPDDVVVRTQGYSLSDSPPFSVAPWIQSRKNRLYSNAFARSSSSEHALDFTHTVYLGCTRDDRNGLHWYTKSHIPHPPLETVPFSPPLISFRRFDDDLWCQILVNQLVRTEIK